MSQHMFDSITKVAGEITTSDNKRPFRSIEATVNIPDVTVRTRRGYHPSAP